MVSKGVPPKQAISYWQRLLTGDGMRKSRLHTYSGNLIDVAGFLYLPEAIWSVILLRAFGKRQKVPWLGYRVVRHLNRLLQPSWNVLEFGSGMSTLFLARNCSQVISIESDTGWHETVKKLTEHLKSKIDMRLRSEESYTELSDVPDRSIDFTLVDGILRDQTAEVAIRKTKPGGYILLDNSDVPYEEYRRARNLLISAAAPEGIRYFNDFGPFQIQVNESMLIRVH